MSTKIISEFIAAWLRRDVEAVLDCLAEDIVYTPSAGPTYHGIDQVAPIFAADITADMGDTQLILDEPVGLGDHVLGGWALADGEGEIFSRGVDVYVIRDGRIAVKDVFRKVFPQS